MKLVVTVTDAHLPNINDVIRNLMNNGCKVTQVMKMLGVIILETADVEKVEKMEGVLKVDVIKDLKLVSPPPIR